MLDEERKDHLPLVVPQRFSSTASTRCSHALGDRHVYASRTRFIPEKLLGLSQGLAACAGWFRGTPPTKDPKWISAAAPIAGCRVDQISCGAARPSPKTKAASLRFRKASNQF